MGLGSGLLQATFGLAIVLGLIWGAAWLMRRIAPTGAPSRSPIKILAAQSIGQREKVVLIEFADNWLLLGVTPNQITPLQTLAKSVLPAPEPVTAPFARLLALAKSKREG
jgi:flagellar protein FliO/FliZ